MAGFPVNSSDVSGGNAPDVSAQRTAAGRSSDPSQLGGAGGAAPGGPAPAQGGAPAAGGESSGLLRQWLENWINSGMDQNILEELVDLNVVVKHTIQGNGEQGAPQGVPGQGGALPLQGAGGGQPPL